MERTRARPPGRRRPRRRATAVLLAAAAALVSAALVSGALVSTAATARAATLPVVSVGSASVLEGNSGLRTMLVPVTLSTASTSSVSVHYATVSGSASASSDFASVSGTLTFSPGTISRAVAVAVRGDTTAEADEELTIVLSSPSGATLGKSTGVGRIINDDPSSGLGVGIGNISVVEGSSGARSVEFAVTLSGASSSPVSVHYATASGTATAGTDFTSASGTVTVPADRTTAFVPVAITGDTTFETSETFTVTLSAPSGATIVRKTGIGTILNDDPGTCGLTAPHAARYDSVVVFAFENRTWSDVGLGFGTQMPYLHGLATRCPYFTSWTETDTNQNSLTQYTGQVTGARQAGTVDDCSPSASCSTTADNIFRQARRAGRSAINYVEGATQPCSASGNASKHIPDLYMWGSDDRKFCTAQVRPFGEFNPNKLPSFAFVTPTLCDDGHDCGDSTVDSWAKAHIQPVLSSEAYKEGKVAVFVWYDEDHPVPNLWLTPTAHTGALSTSGAGYAGTLKAWESMLGFPCLANACSAVDMRTPANS